MHAPQAQAHTHTPAHMQTPVLRAARPDDRPGVEALLVANRLPLDGVPPNLDCFVVAEAAEGIVGVAGIERCGHGEHALLRSVAVADAWKGRGLGRQLVLRSIADAEARGAQALYLLTTTAESYFPSFGFVPVARDAVPAEIRATEEFASACPASAAVMVRERRA